MAIAWRFLLVLVQKYPSPRFVLAPRKMNLARLRRFYMYSTRLQNKDLGSNRGICDEEIGVCSCMDYMTTSDGYGNEGQRGDCGYASQQLVDCPNENSPCNMKGTCQGKPTYRCDCQQGWTGADCSLLTCPYGKTWFGRPTTGDDYAHMTDDIVECSNMGTCNRVTGTCSCMEGFEGAA